MWIPALENANGPKYKAIALAIAKAIEVGDLQPGDRLPPQRELAYALELSVQTISRAYAEAVRQRLVTGEVGRGTYVQYRRSDSVSTFIHDDAVENVVDMSGLAPVLDDTHRRHITETLNAITRAGDYDNMLAARPIAGTAAHRAAGSAWLQRQGVYVDADRVIMTNGCQHGLWAALVSLAQPGDVIACDQLVDGTLLINASILKLQVRGIETDKEGLIPDALEDVCRREKIKAICTTPNFNVPTATLMGKVRRERIAEIAQRYGVFVIEDDVYGPLMSRSLPPLHSLIPELTCYATSFSKSVLHSLRCGYLVVPDALRSRLLTRIRAAGWMTNTWTSEVASQWISDGTLKELIKWQKIELRARFAITKEELAGFKVRGHPTCLHGWLELPGVWRPNQFVEHAEARGVLVAPPEPFMVGRIAEPHAFRFTIGGLCATRDTLRRGLRTLSSALKDDPEPSVSGLRLAGLN